MLLKSFIDVKRVFKEKTTNFTKIPSSILRISCFYEEVEIALSHPDQRDSVIRLLKDWFGTWLDEKRLAILLDINDAVLPIEFIEDETRTDEYLLNRPFWHENAYLKSNNDNEEANQLVPPPAEFSNSLKMRVFHSFKEGVGRTIHEEANQEEANQSVPLPAEFSNSLKMTVFHSFKGGVGRTTHLVAYLLALLERAKKLKKEVNILVIDSDLEAPGLTYWQRHANLELSVSLIDFLEAYHYPPTTRETVIAFYAKELKRTQHPLGFYLLPAFLTEHQLLDIQVLPEHLVRDSDDVWEYSQAFEELAKALKAHFVLIDSRAGLSELASPLLFDPRLERYLVTTLSEQSVRGTCLVLDLLARMMPNWQIVKEGKYLDPTVVISMIPPELVESPIDTENTRRLSESYPDDTDDLLPRLKVEKTHFAQELLLLSSWDDARQKLAGTSMMKRAKQWAEEAFYVEETSSSSPLPHPEVDPFEKVKKLKEICKKYEYAEHGESDDLLITEPLKNLAKNHVEKLPKLVSIGAKGAGKTFNYLQLVKLGTWNNFLEKTGVTTEEHHNTFIFPLLKSKQLKPETTETPIKQAREAFLQAVGHEGDSFLLSQLNDEITEKLSRNLNELEWGTFWVDTLGKLIHHSSASSHPSDTPTSQLTAMDAYLKQKNLRVIFLFDGLEELFSEVAQQPAQRYALKALLDLPHRLDEIRQASIGVILFLRRDFVRYVIPQNVGQFENRYEAYDLSWNFKSFLQLVYWICAQIDVIGAKSERVYELSTEDLRQQLELFWGKRLGTDTSKEAYTVRWIYAALTDFKGKLQARDIVRLLLFAAEYSITNKEVFKKWKSSRLLPPSAIRDSVGNCSEKKVEEAKNEYPAAFKNWVDKLPVERKIPFNPQDFSMGSSTLEILQDLGVIYEDKETKGKARFYIPEIFRAGLNFKTAQGRARIIALKRRMLEDAGDE